MLSRKVVHKWRYDRGKQSGASLIEFLSASIYGSVKQALDEKKETFEKFIKIGDSLDAGILDFIQGEIYTLEKYIDGKA